MRIGHDVDWEIVLTKACGLIYLDLFAVFWDVSNGITPSVIFVSVRSLKIRWTNWSAGIGVELTWMGDQLWLL